MAVEAIDTLMHDSVTGEDMENSVNAKFMRDSAMEPS
jgi:hypothetical protein